MFGNLRKLFDSGIRWYSLELKIDCNEGEVTTVEVFTSEDSAPEVNGRIRCYSIPSLVATRILWSASEQRTRDINLQRVTGR